MVPPSGSHLIPDHRATCSSVATTPGDSIGSHVGDQRRAGGVERHRRVHLRLVPERRPERLPHPGPAGVRAPAPSGPASGGPASGGPASGGPASGEPGVGDRHREPRVWTRVHTGVDQVHELRGVRTGGGRRQQERHPQTARTRLSSDARGPPAPAKEGARFRPRREVPERQSTVGVRLAPAGKRAHLPSVPVRGRSADMPVLPSPYPNAAPPREEPRNRPAHPGGGGDAP